jgi:two-component system cell cycle sensor histidine kinase/response regulator CckA
MSKKIFVVDNHPLMLKFMQDLLEKEGHRVWTAADGLGCLELLETTRPDLIFIDLVMPNIDGEKLCQIIRSRDDLDKVRLVILSAIAAEENVDVVSLGADGCIAKGPFNKMTHNVLKAVDLTEKKDRTAEPEVLGLEDIYKREITAELLSAKNHFELILSNMEEGILEINREAKIVYANPPAITLFAVQEEKLLASCFGDYFQEKSRSVVKDLLEKKAPGAAAGPLELKDREVLLKILPFREEDSRSCIVILIDVTEKRRIEARLQQAQQMEAIATLAGGIAHEFNNNLLSVTGNLELLEMELKGQKPVEEHVAPMRMSLDMMARLTDQLLVYAEGGKGRATAINLSELVKYTLPLVRHTLAPSIQVDLDLRDDTPRVTADYSLLQMVFSAVIANSVEAIAEKGQIRIGTRRVILDKRAAAEWPEAAAGDYACLSVEDDGQGMDEDTRRRIFEPFFSTKFAGRGLSMAAAYGLVRHQGGWISVSSEVGRGARVEIFLPATPA